MLISSIYDKFLTFTDNYSSEIKNVFIKFDNYLNTFRDFNLSSFTMVYVNNTPNAETKFTTVVQKFDNAVAPITKFNYYWIRQMLLKKILATDSVKSIILTGHFQKKQLIQVEYSDGAYVDSNGILNLFDESNIDLYLKSFTQLPDDTDDFMVEVLSQFFIQKKPYKIIPDNIKVFLNILKGDTKNNDIISSSSSASKLGELNESYYLKKQEMTTLLKSQKSLNDSHNDLLKKIKEIQDTQSIAFNAKSKIDNYTADLQRLTERNKVIEDIKKSIENLLPLLREEITLGLEDKNPDSDKLKRLKDKAVEYEGVLKKYNLEFENNSHHITEIDSNIRNLRSNSQETEDITVLQNNDKEVLEKINLISEKVRVISEDLSLLSLNMDKEKSKIEDLHYVDKINYSQSTQFVMSNNIISPEYNAVYNFLYLLYLDTGECSLQNARDILRIGEVA